ncbi:DUF4145 domain-containing protein [Vibrio splendidus]|uniref:DUF4145 domain-containing protein n=1 Tax=Vibrio splendidus 12E03 TaxID=1191305 RepID=A0A1E5FW47_VIBSP|nr:DUF4145 domain-containing protein [Vibrio splendidus]OEF94668.1 hypothetical protein A142_16345 [Vibrio splendidus 12E03]
MKQSILYTEEQVPAFKCPSCIVGDMVPIGDLSCRQIVDARTGGDARALLRSDLMCQNKECGNVGVIVMSGESYSDDEGGYEMLFTPTYVSPAPNFFTLDRKYPYKIRALLELVFSLFWVEQSSCGNKLRVAVEELLTQLGVDQYRTKNDVPLLSKKGYPKPIPLQERLDQCKKAGKVHRKCIQALEAIKWLGNESSHSSDGVFQHTTYQAIMVFGAVLEQVYLGVELPNELEFSVNNVNFFYNPNEQQVRPKK